MLKWNPFKKSFDPLGILLLLTMILVTVSSVVVKQSAVRVIPLYVSMVISLLHSKVNRYAYLLGGLNSISYGFIALYYHIPGTAISAFLFNCPLQLLSFIRWSKTSWKHSTVLKKMTPKGRGYNLLFLVAGGAVYYLLIRALGSASSLVDAAASFLGAYITVLQLLKYSEYTLCMIPSGLLTITLYISLMVQGSMEQLPFLIYACFSFACTLRSVRQARRILEEQKKNQPEISG